MPEMASSILPRAILYWGLLQRLEGWSYKPLTGVRLSYPLLNSILQLDRILKSTNNNKVAENCVIGNIPCDAWHTYGLRKKGLKAPYCVWSRRFKFCQGGLREVGRYGYCGGLKIHRSWIGTNTSHYLL